MQESPQTIGIEHVLVSMLLGGHAKTLTQSLLELTGDKTV